MKLAFRLLLNGKDSKFSKLYSFRGATAITLLSMTVFVAQESRLQ